ncbi:MAG: hypothetical protein KGM99_19310, partial [Burkholderiales bacterium]|nr:hypothetical protein [Burkholderiales bacterium]
MQQAQTLMGAPALGTVIEPITQRSLSFLDADISAVKALAQAAINVELFTIPLYMTTMYSIYGMHQINARGQTYYKGREWPGLATRAKPVNENEKAFNIIFSVFIQEMLHLQMAANIGTAIGIAPTFVSEALQTKEHGWHCYGPDNSIIPHIVDLKDTKDYAHVKVNLEALNQNQTSLFLAIEQPADKANGQFDHLSRDYVEGKYFPKVPFKGWKKENTELDLPMFGTIGHMYECYAQYLSIEYADGKNLWQKIFCPDSVQQDLFNTDVKGSGHPKKEFPRFDTLLTKEDCKDAMQAFDKAIDMMSAISDQGEGNKISIQRFRKHHLLKAVDGKYQEDRDSLEADYLSYDQKGDPAPSRDAAARADSKALDHYERFQEIQVLLHKVMTWDKVHAAWDRDKTGWTKASLTNAEYDEATAPKNIPKPEQVAAALNNLKAQGE